MVLYKYGGLYLDLDVECFSPADDSLRDSTIVLQGSGVEGVTNAIMASAPLNAFWLEVLRICKERATKPEYSWDPVQSTGPKAVGEAIRQLFNVSSLLDLGFIGKVLEVRDQLDRACKCYAQNRFTTHLADVASPQLDCMLQMQKPSQPLTCCHHAARGYPDKNQHTPSRGLVCTVLVRRRHLLAPIQCRPSQRNLGHGGPGWGTPLYWIMGVIPEHASRCCSFIV